MSEVEKFLEDTEVDPTRVDILEQPLHPEKSEKTETEESSEHKGGEEKPRNRRERRLMASRDNEAKSAAFLAGKLEALTEARTVVNEEADYLKLAERIYGTDSPEAMMATDLLKKAITGARDDAENRAYTRIKEEQDTRAKEVNEASDELDSIFDTIEDEYGFEMNPAQEQAFLGLLEKMSPKNAAGEVTAYADPHAVFEVFQERLKKPSETNSRAKDLSSRSMVKSGASTESKTGEDATARYLSEQGII